MASDQVDETEKRVTDTQIVTRRKHERCNLLSGVERCSRIWAGNGGHLLWLENVLLPALANEDHVSR